MRITLAIVAIVGACSTTALAGPDPSLGETVRANIAVQTIDLDPHYAGVPTAGDNGQRAVDAVTRYRTGKLKPLLKINGKPDLGSQGGADDSPAASTRASSRASSSDQN